LTVERKEMTTIFVYCLSSSKWFVYRVNNKTIHKYFRIDDIGEEGWPKEPVKR